MAATLSSPEAVSAQPVAFQEIPPLEVGSVEPVFVQRGIASWYGGWHHGRRTASGERYDKTDLTAAHRTLPFNSVVRVRNLTNQREVIVRINNRGPFVRGRIIDLSEAAARELGMIRAGIVPVEIEVIQ